MQNEIGTTNITHEKIKEYLWKTLKSGQVVPGYGHGVLRSPDPRFIALQQFCDAHPELSNSPIIQLVKKTSEVAPDVLKEHGKTKNPYPNVDATSGCLLYHYGLNEFKYYTVIFGVSRGTPYIFISSNNSDIYDLSSWSLDSIRLGQSSRSSH